MNTLHQKNRQGILDKRVIDNGKTKERRGTEDLQGNVGEVQGRGKVRTGDDLRSGERRVGQDAVEGRSEGNGKDISLLTLYYVIAYTNSEKNKKV